MKTESLRAPDGRNGGRHAAVLRKQTLDGLGRDETPRPAGLDKSRLLAALSQLKKGNFDVRLPEDCVGLDGKIADAFNQVVELNQWMNRELARLSRVVGKQGRISER
ncbi:MAG TPA: hypothetical protein VER78_02725, partial [Thermoanaerobaculia bacterium]|nr:hypothetical protein [Thermoanaerobaculia bacterium]